MSREESTTATTAAATAAAAADEDRARPFPGQVKSDSGEDRPLHHGLSPSRTARRGAEGTEAGNFQGGPLSGFSPGCQKLGDKKRRSFRTTRSKHVISTRSGDLAGAHHFCLTASARVGYDFGGRAGHQVSTAKARRNSLGVASSSRRHAAAELMFTSSPPIRFAPTQAAAPFWIAMGIKESRLHRGLRHQLNGSRRLFSLSLSIGWGARVQAHTPPCFCRWCRTFSVSLPPTIPRR